MQPERKNVTFCTNGNLGSFHKIFENSEKQKTCFEFDLTFIFA